MEEIQKQYAFMITSKRRIKVLQALEKKPLRPIQIARKIKIAAPNVSVTLFQLQKRGLVICLNEKNASWRVYGITEEGKNVSRQLKL